VDFEAVIAPASMSIKSWATPHDLRYYSASLRC
jgi:hypothetical protein